MSEHDQKFYWRSLEELARAPEFQKKLDDEWPQGADPGSSAESPANLTQIGQPPPEPWNEAVTRRQMLKLAGTAAAVTGLTGCVKQPEEHIVPFVRPPEEMVPGRALYFATAMTLGGYAVGLLAESQMGRPIKLEGNPQHPASLGATDPFAQAAVLTLYDGDRSQVITNNGRISTWVSFQAAIRPQLEASRGVQGYGVRILTETVTSPTLAEQIRAFLAEFPNARWHQYEPVNTDNARAGAQLAFGAPLNAIYRFDVADVVLSLDADFLSCGPANLGHVREFAARRSPAAPDHGAHGKAGDPAVPGVAQQSGGASGAAHSLNPQQRADEDKREDPSKVHQAGEHSASGPAQPAHAGMNRLYVVEPGPSNTGAKADHRLPLRASDIENFARAVAAQLGVAQAGGQPGQHGNWINAVARDLQAHRGRSLVIAGDQQPPIVHALAHAMNQALGNVGSTVVLTEPVEANPESQIESLRQLVGDMKGGQVQLLAIMGGANPVYNAPSDMDFVNALHKVKLRVHHGLYVDETAVLCHWHVPEAHFLESWGDARAYDGTVTIQQPLIAPLYDGKSIHEFFNAISGKPERPGMEIVRDYWRTRLSGGAGAATGARAATPPRPAAAASQAAGSQAAPAASAGTGTSGPLPSAFDLAWRKAVHDGVVPGTSLPARQPAARAQIPAQASTPGGGLEIVFRPDPTIHDGRFANNGWLQELPKPLTKLTWDNVALMSAETAQRLGVVNQDVVELRYRGRSVRAPVWIQPGCANDSITVHLGYGRTRAGKVGNGIGFNAYTLRTSDQPWFGTGLEARKTGDTYGLACTQDHHPIDERHVIRTASFANFQHDPHFAHKLGHAASPELSLYPEYKYEGNAWGMTIDTSKCVGCNACVAACNAENNIVVVGKREVQRGREMHWIRIDRYHSGAAANPQFHYQPMLCQQCEKAPCEVVCPVGATMHSSEGLNDMVYNRCVGTRYCSNNCPYKVRRFNFFNYVDYDTPSLRLMRNPDVTVRMRGVMEKCTYCVQRINRARIDAKKEDREILDGEILTACQAACAADAIVFGNINDKNSRVAKLKADPRNYGVLADLGTQPRTTYLAELRNPNPELEKA